ncbi:MAG: hypothetical protein WDW36_000149 [Sanguina aurantia]
MSVTPALHLPIFEGGQLKANYGISKAQLAAAVAGYVHGRDAVAAHDVANQARTAHRRAARRKEQGWSPSPPTRAATLARAAPRHGAPSLQAQAVSTDLALIKALGGGYHASGESNTSSTSSMNSPGDDAHERH